MPPPPTGNGPGPEPLDGPIGRFLLPIGGGSAEATWTLHFHINCHGQTVFWPQPAHNKD